MCEYCVNCSRTCGEATVQRLSELFATRVTREELYGLLLQSELLKNNHAREPPCCSSSSCVWWVTGRACQVIYPKHADPIRFNLDPQCFIMVHCLSCCCQSQLQSSARSSHALDLQNVSRSWAILAKALQRETIYALPYCYYDCGCFSRTLGNKLKSFGRGMGIQWHVNVKNWMFSSIYNLTGPIN